MSGILNWMHSNSGKVVVTAILGALTMYLTGQTNGTGAVGMIIASILPGLKSRVAPTSTPNPRA